MGLIIIVCLLAFSSPIGAHLKCIGLLAKHKSFVNMADEEFTDEYKFPCIDRKQKPQMLMVLQTKQNSIQRTIKVYNISDLINMISSVKNIELEPVWEYPISQATGELDPGDFFGFQDTPYCFHTGLYFLIKQSNQQWIIYHGTNRNPVYKGHNLPWFFTTMNNELAYSIKNSVYINEKKQFTWNHHIISFDQPHSKYRAINYYNSYHNPDIILKIKGKEININDPLKSELYPKFSTKINYVAYFQNRSENPEIWDLVVRSTSPPYHQNIITNARMYDIQETAFFFHDSFQWFDNRLYYLSHSSPLSLFEYIPESGKTKEIEVSGIITTKIVEHTDFEVPRKFTFEVLLKTIDWFQVSKNSQGDLIVIAESFLQTLCPNCSAAVKTPMPIRRIVILKEEKK